MSLTKIEISVNNRAVLLFKNLSGKWIPAYSKRNPFLAARKWKNKCKEIIKNNPDTLIVGIGCSLLYEWPTNKLGKSLILIEPDYNDLNILFANKASDLFASSEANDRTIKSWAAVANVWKRSKDVSIFSSEYKTSEILSVLKTNSVFVKKIIVLVNPFYERLFPKECEKIKQNWINSNSQKKNSFSKTINHFLLQWKRNWFKNLVYSEKTKINNDNLQQAVEQVRENSFLCEGKTKTNLPVLIIAAGPGLDNAQTIEKIKKMQANCFCICTDTALAFALRNGIVPDVIMSIDSARGSFYHLLEIFKDKNAKQYKKILQNIPLLSWPGANCNLLKQYPGPNYFYLSSFPWDQFLAACLPLNNQHTDRHKANSLKPVLSNEKLCSLANPGGNILSAAMEFAFQFFSAEVFLFGVDVYNESKPATHYRGSAYESFRLPLLNRLQTMENLNRSYGLSVHFENYMKNLSKETRKKIYISGNKNFATKFGVQDLNDSLVAGNSNNKKNEIFNNEKLSLPFAQFIDLFRFPEKDLENLLFNHYAEFIEYSSLFNIDGVQKENRERFLLLT